MEHSCHRIGYFLVMSNRLKVHVSPCIWKLAGEFQLASDLMKLRRDIETRRDMYARAIICSNYSDDMCDYLFEQCLWIDRWIAMDDDFVNNHEFDPEYFFW